MNAQVEDWDSSDDERGEQRPVHNAPREPEVLLVRHRDHQREDVSRNEVTKGPEHHTAYIQQTQKKLPSPRHRKSRRHTSRKYPNHRPQELAAAADQDSDDVLDEYYGGAPITSMHARPSMSMYDPFEMRISDDPWAYPAPRPFQSGPVPPAIHITNNNGPVPEMDFVPEMGFGPPGPPPTGPPPPMFTPPPEDPDHRRRRRQQRISRPLYRPSYGARPTRVPDITTIRDPPQHHTGGLWSRAAMPDQLPGVMTVILKLVLTRKGERYKGRSISYATGSWDDVAFADRLRKEYRSLKTDQIGMMQKLTSYKTISFVYFLQYHAFEDPHFRFGRWEITDRVPIVPRQDEKARSFFMYQFKKRVRKESKIFSTLSDKSPPPPKRHKDWVQRLEMLIEPGAVIDIEVKETFDSMKIYFGLLLAVLLSLGVALAYGFVMDNDFSTGFSIASWLLTAFGFFAAVVAAGEYLGLDSPTATLSAAEELSAGRKLDRDLLDPRMYAR